MGSSPSIMERLAEMVMGYFSPGEGEQFTYEDLERRKKIAAALMSQAGDYSPVQSWTQGAARLASGLVGGLEREYANKLSKEGGKAYNEQLAKISSGGQSGGSMPSAAPSPIPTGGGSLPAMASGGNIPKMVMPDPVYGNLDATQKALLNAIAAPESAGAYNIRYTPKGGATFAGFDAHPGVFEPGPAGPSSAAGRYQFTKTTWDRMGGGEFTPENQDKRALALANQDYKARTGRDLMADIQANGFTPQIAQALGPTWRGLIDNPQKAIAAFQSTMQRNQQPPAQVAQAGMTPDGMPTTPVPSNAPPMSYAPGQQAIAAPQQPAQGQRLAQAVTSPPIPAPQPTGNVQQAMTAILIDPRFSPQQKDRALQLYQMTQAKADFDFQVAGDQLYRINKRTGQAEPVPGASAAKPSDVQKQFEQAKREGFQGNLIDYQRALAEARRPQTNVNIDNKTETAADTETAKALIKRSVAAMDAADKAQAAMGDIGTMREISRRVGSVGSTADLKAAIGPYAEAVGVNLDGLSDIQAFEAVIQRLAPQMRAEGSGSTSDIEFKGMLASLPRLRSNPQAREMILDTMEANARYNIQRGDIALKVLTKEIKREDGEKMMRALGDPMQAFREFRKQNPALFTGPPPKDEPRQMSPQERALEELRRRGRT
jgi:muramidase (phage lysozyme)